MKKLYIVAFIVVAFSSSLFSMEIAQEHAKKEVAQKQSEQKPPVQTQFNKKDWAKVGAASLGCILFGGLCATAYPAYKWDIAHKDLNGVKLPAKYYPYLLWTLPAFYINYLLFPESHNKEHASLPHNFGGIASGIISGALGMYAYKKLSQLRTSKIQESKKVS